MSVSFCFYFDFHHIFLDLFTCFVSKALWKTLCERSALVKLLQVVCRTLISIINFHSNPIVCVCCCCVTQFCVFTSHTCSACLRGSETEAPSTEKCHSIAHTVWLTSDLHKRQEHPRNNHINTEELNISQNLKRHGLISQEQSLFQCKKILQD